ncbi:NADH-quinone oxidoreductase subunit NuoG [Zoogloea sp.]|uniref:NADH-quinone oxidoreductase subunit NuoG n=1 Tax=Zoogloea sp. TaxID=49181 RepID=UPI0026371789|nr:NADH-quinone oxidoreductase subunit NuoG [Zoogloea sp.]MDD3353842.1 NADH-quinone oxidoreductase subunit NuoG [Zoogloea sp.]
MLEIEIDGKQLQVPDGSTVMEAANQVGAYVPHFCYHKKLSIAANCRMCLVQVEKAPKPLPACATPVTNGMKVWTHSEQAVKAQKGVMEFLLINHPLDCPICDQGGECQLQDLSVGYGAGQSRYQEEKRVVANKDLGPLVSTDMTRCINCTRCVRFTSEIAGLMELGQAFRGEHAEIMTFVEKTVDTELSGNIIDLCPVGALTSKPFRFDARAWEMSRRKSVSPHDSLGSNLIVQVKHDTVKRVLPLENEAINECWLSDKDRFSYEALTAGERLAKPMVKQGGQWLETDWSTALEYVVNGLRSIQADHGKDSVGALVSPHSTLEEMYLVQSLMRGIGSDNVDFRLRQVDFSNDGKMAGAPWLGMPIAETGTLDRLLVVGSFFRKDHPLLAQRVRQGIKKGLKLSAINSAFDDWQMPVANTLCVAPSGMAAALLAVLKALVEVTGKDAGPAFTDALQGVSASSEARAIAESLASGRRAAVWLGNAAVQHGAAATLHAISQEIAQLAGARFGVIGEAANSVGGYIAGAIPFGSEGHGKNAVQMLTQGLKGYVLFNLEAELDTAFGNQAAEMIGKAEMVALCTPFKSAKALEYADVLLPIAPFTETAGVFVNTEGRAQSFHPVVKALGDSRPGWKVLRVIGEMLGVQGFDFDKVEEVRKRVLDADGLVADVRLDNTVRIDSVAVEKGKGGIERVSDVSIYAADALVRRAPALQATKDAEQPKARMSAATLGRLGIQSGSSVRVGGVVVLDALEDKGVADNCVRIAGGHALTASLGALFGEISVERV